MKVGDKIWRFDHNRRVYPKTNDQYRSVPPIYAEHWVPVEIVGETSRSWIVDWFKAKVPKKGPHHGYAFTQKEVDDDVWVHSHCWRLREVVSVCKDADVLRKVAELVGYKPEENQ